MKELKIDFKDFWLNFNKTDNYFYNLLNSIYELVIDENPEILFYSCFGKEYLKYNCKRIFYTGENIRPDFTACDFAFTFDYLRHKNHFRLPLYSLYIDEYKMLPHLEKKKTREEASEIWNKKTKFCCFVVSNPKCAKRIEFFKHLSCYKHVDSGGLVLNNIGGPVSDKIKFIKDYKFVISFENCAQDGYTTEKIIEPIFQDCIPIYWGNKLVNRDFNFQRFLNYNQFESEKELIKRILEIDQNRELAIDIIEQPTFNENNLRHEIEKQLVLEVINKIINSRDKAIALQYYKYLHLLKLFHYKNWSLLKSFLYKINKRILSRMKFYLYKLRCINRWN